MRNKETRSYPHSKHEGVRLRWNHPVNKGKTKWSGFGTCEGLQLFPDGGEHNNGSGGEPS